jgi:hypothetical protein
VSKCLVWRFHIIASFLFLPMEQLGSHWMDFYEIWYSTTFRKYVEKIQVLLKSDKSNGYFTQDLRTVHLWCHVHFFLGWEIFQTIMVGKIKIYILCWMTVFLLWDIVETYSRPRQATNICMVLHMRTVWWIRKATDAHSECVILIAFRRQHWLRERASLLRLYAHCLPWVLI